MDAHPHNVELPYDELDDLVAEVVADPASRASLEDAEALFELLRRLRQLRKARRVKQREVAALMGTTQSAVSNIEGGATDPQISTLMRYARAVGAHLVLQMEPGTRLDSASASAWVQRPSNLPLTRPRVVPLRRALQDYLPPVRAA